MSNPRDTAEVLRFIAESMDNDDGRLIDAAADVFDKLWAKNIRQRRELQRLNKVLGPYWDGFRRGLYLEGELRLRRIMIAAFGSEAVYRAERADLERHIAQELGDGAS